MPIKARDGGLADPPDPPYYAVIFTSRLSEDDGGYAAMADRMEALALAQGRLAGLGVDRQLARAGAREGDTVHIGDLEFTYDEAGFGEAAD